MIQITNSSIDFKKFSTLPYQKKVDKPWGYEIIYTKDGSPVTGKIIHLFPNKRLSLQFHDTKVETLCLIKGKATMTLSNEKNELVELKMVPFHGYFVTQGQTHRVTSVTEVDIIESSTPEAGNTYRLQDDAGRETETEAMRKLPDRGWNKKS